MSVYKVDGIGTHKDGSGGEIVNQEERVRIVRFRASEAIEKGHAVALDLAATEPDFGYGNSVKMADTDDALNQHAFGIALEAAASGDIVDVQVEGICDIAQVVTALSDSDEGKMLAASATTGELSTTDENGADGSGFLTPCAILIEYGTAATADSKVYLLNILKM